MEDRVALDLQRQLHLVSLRPYLFKDREGTFIKSNDAVMLTTQPHVVVYLDKHEVSHLEFP